MKNNPHETKVICPHCKSNIIINDEYPHGMSVFKDGYDYQCSSCGKLVNKEARKLNVLTKIKNQR